MVEAFARLIREIRQQYRYRQRDLSEALGTHRSAVAAWELDTRNPSRLHLDELARRFPEYRSRLYVSARLLPLDLDAEVEYQLCALLERDTPPSYAR